MGKTIQDLEAFTQDRNGGRDAIKKTPPYPCLMERILSEEEIFVMTKINCVLRD